MRGTALALALVAAAVALAGCDETSRAAPTTTTTTGDTAGDPNNYQVGQRVDGLVVRVDAGSVQVRSAAGEAPPVVAEELNYDDEKPRTRHRVDGGVLYLTATCPSGGARRCWVDYTVTVEDSVDLTIETGAGDIVVDGNTRSVEASTEAGNVRASGLAGSATASSEAGNVSLAFVSSPGHAEATSSAGDVTVRVPADVGYQVDARTGLGERAVEVPTSSGSQWFIRARTEVGDVSVLPAG